MNDSQLEPQWRYGDLREWLRETEKLGELKTVLGASWQEEIGSSFRHGDSKRRWPGGYL